ncbi:MAG: hypothetical protein GKR89_09330 [Candidatus Latescibacteria bacterium]|nr:hypothetical protein [Candidatus Latescibacterota bacterium]
MPRLTARRIQAPPSWALMERNLIALMEESGRLFARKYFERGGGTLLAEDVDDLYEQMYNFGLFYSMGAADDLLDIHFQNWNAVTRISDDSLNHRTRFNDHKKVFRPSIRNEFWNLDQAMEWHHLSEGNMAFYDFGVADPTVSENLRRARRFAAMFTGEDPQAPNWDPEHRILRSPFHSSQGPKLHGDADMANIMLLGGRGLGGQANYYGVRASLFPLVKDLEPRWFENGPRRRQITELFDRLVLQCDTPNSLAATALVTNAYLYTGDAKYRQWVLDYTEAWMERTQQNGGICPDNVDAKGIIGGGREGVCWGGLYGWNHYQGYNIMFHGINIAVECAQLLTGDSGYLDFLRSQIKLQIDNGRKRDDGQLLVPVRYGPDGWDWNPTPGLQSLDGIEMRGYWLEPTPLRGQDIMHLYHASLSHQDYQLVCQVRDGDVERDWNDIGSALGEKNWGNTEFARFQYYDGKNPGWPEQILQAEYQQALETYRYIQADQRSSIDLIATNQIPSQPVLTKGLTQVALGAPQSVYNGGLLRATVRYFDEDRGRPGLPLDVAALVDELGADRVGLQLVNTHRRQTRRLVVQAGAFAEHSFTRVKFAEEGRDGESEIAVEGTYIAIELPPATAIRLEAGLDRFANQGSYAFPWHREGIPVPFPA